MESASSNSTNLNRCALRAAVAEEPVEGGSDAAPGAEAKVKEPDSDNKSPKLL